MSDDTEDIVIFVHSTDRFLKQLGSHAATNVKTNLLQNDREEDADVLFVGDDGQTELL